MVRREIVEHGQAEKLCVRLLPGVLEKTRSKEAKQRSPTQANPSVETKAFGLGARVVGAEDGVVGGAGFLDRTVLISTIDPLLAEGLGLYSKSLLFWKY